MMRRAIGIAAAAAMMLGGCAYYNALYNAHRAFDAAERAAALGQNGEASAQYGVTIDKARRSLERDPDGRWSDDALILMGRAHFARGNLQEARGALEQALGRAGGEDARAAVRALLGATDLRLERPDSARAHLDAALAGGLSPEDAVFAHLWRARARLALGDTVAAWSDLERAVEGQGRVGVEARIEHVAWSVRLDQRDRAAAAFAALLRDPAGRSRSDTLRALTSAAAVRWGGAVARELTGSVTEAPWPAPARDSLALVRARLAAEAGDTAVAEAEARILASRGSRSVADMARVQLARWSLARAEALSDLEAVRAILLPSLHHEQARRLVRDVKVLAVLLERAEQGGQALALFAAGELARDALGAGPLARRLFLAYADIVPDAVWAPKALLAALALATDPEEHAAIRRRLAASQSSVYLAAASGRRADADFVSAEERLQRALSALVGSAAMDAERRDALVEGAVASLDSLRASARADSVRLACGGLVDSLALAGVVGDSVRVACLRGDSVRVQWYIANPDSLTGSGKRTIRSDSFRIRRTERPDTFDL